MKRFSLSAAASGLLFQLVSAAPAPVPAAEPATPIEERALLPSVINAIGSIINSAATPTAIIGQLNSISPTATPTDISGLQSTLSSIYGSATPTNIYDPIASQIANGLGPSNLAQYATSTSFGGNNSQNNNNPAPRTKIFPKKKSTDAPYDLSESDLRSKIKLPSNYSYGKRMAILFVPGTGAPGAGINFDPNLAKLLGGSYDPVYLNIPNAVLGDAQVNAEYIAYAMNYLYSINKSKQIAVVGWSQGNLDTQWALKYWPSTRTTVQDFLAVSADFHGTVNANAICLAAVDGIGLGPCDPSVIQQEYNSNFVTRLRQNGGDSAYVPTTSVYTGLLDEIVQPQEGAGASAFLNDARNVGVTNNEIQSVCNGYADGAAFYGHAGVLYASLTFALFQDALTHSGPGQVSRLNLANVCSQYAATGLSFEDVLNTVNIIPIAGVELLAFPNKMLIEPPLKNYATS